MFHSPNITSRHYLTKWNNFPSAVLSFDQESWMEVSVKHLFTFSMGQITTNVLFLFQLHLLILKNVQMRFPFLSQTTYRRGCLHTPLLFAEIQKMFWEVLPVHLLPVRRLTVVVIRLYATVLTHKSTQIPVKWLYQVTYCFPVKQNKIATCREWSARVGQVLDESCIMTVCLSVMLKLSSIFCV